MNRHINLVSYPEGMPNLSHFEMQESPIPEPKDGEVLVKTKYLSVDPYMRGRMSGKTSYVPPFQTGQPLNGGVVGEVVKSNSPNLKIGDTVLGNLNWAEYSVAKGEDLQKVDPKHSSLFLGILGMPGMTAYFGLLDIGQPKQGETVVVSGAAGAVGMAVGQIAKLKGCHVVGIAGSDDKINYLTQELGFDSAINYKDPNFIENLKKSCPKGVDVYFDNVGGDITDQVIRLINRHARIVLCGQISMYNESKPDTGIRPYVQLLVKSSLMKGFIITIDYQNRFPEGYQQMAEWIAQGKLKYKETVVNGLENAPKAFLGLFSGSNTGKQIVKVG